MGAPPIDITVNDDTGRKKPIRDVQAGQKRRGRCQGFIGPWWKSPEVQRQDVVWSSLEVGGPFRGTGGGPFREPRWFPTVFLRPEKALKVFFGPRKKNDFLFPEIFNGWKMYIVHVEIVRFEGDMC